MKTKVENFLTGRWAQPLAAGLFLAGVLIGALVADSWPALVVAHYVVTGR